MRERESVRVFASDIIIVAALRWTLSSQAVGCKLQPTSLATQLGWAGANPTEWIERRRNLRPIRLKLTSSRASQFHCVLASGAQTYKRTRNEWARTRLYRTGERCRCMDGWMDQSMDRSGAQSIDRSICTLGLECDISLVVVARVRTSER